MNPELAAHRTNIDLDYSNEARTVHIIRHLQGGVWGWKGSHTPALILGGGDVNHTVCLSSRPDLNRLVAGPTTG